MKVQILVLNYNGRDLIERFFPSIIKAAKKSKNDCSAGVVDNLSTDDSVSFFRRNFPEANLYLAKKNEINCSYTEILKTLDSDIVILLNNDIEVKEDFVDYLIGHFEDKDVFFVAPRIMNFDNTFNGGKSYLHFNLGVLKNIVDYDNSNEPGITHSIGTGAFRRTDFLNFGGYDKLYLPGIWEEVDICYRAQICGKKGIYEPRSIIWHQESTTFNKVYGSRKKAILAHRNMFVFIWKNVRDLSLLLEHLFCLPFRLSYSVFTGKPEFAIGFFSAIPLLPKALFGRFRISPTECKRKLKDRDIIK